jgi:hypothetical protein
VRKRVHERGRDREVWVEEVTEADPLCLGNEPKRVGLRVEAPTTPTLGNFETSFIISIEKAVRQTSRGVLECDFNRGRAEPSDVDNRGDTLGAQTTDNAVAADILELRDGATSPGSRATPRLVRPLRGSNGSRCGGEAARARMLFHPAAYDPGRRCVLAAPSQEK